KSLKIAMNRMALRAQLETTIADTEKETNAAELLRATASNEDQNQASLVPRLPTTVPTQQDTWTRTAPEQDTKNEIAADPFEGKGPQSAQQQDERSSKQSSITTPILELFNQRGGFVKRK